MALYLPYLNHNLKQVDDHCPGCLEFRFYYVWAFSLYAVQYTVVLILDKLKNFIAFFIKIKSDISYTGVLLPLPTRMFISNYSKFINICSCENVSPPLYFLWMTSYICSHVRTSGNVQFARCLFESVYSEMEYLATFGQQIVGILHSVMVHATSVLNGQNKLFSVFENRHHRHMSCCPIDFSYGILITDICTIVSAYVHYPRVDHNIMPTCIMMMIMRIVLIMMGIRGKYRSRNTTTASTIVLTTITIKNMNTRQGKFVFTSESASGWF